jgi:hypothetical protein
MAGGDLIGRVDVVKVGGAGTAVVVGTPSFDFQM